MTKKPIQKIPFEGDPQWIQSKELSLMVYPVNGPPTKDMLSSMALEMDRDENGVADFFLFKLTKEEFLEKFNHEFECEHQWILARLVKKEEDEWTSVIPPDDNRRLRITLVLLPKGTLDRDVPVQWVGNIGKSKDVN